MRLSKIQNFLNDNNINYTYTSDAVGGNEFGEIRIKDARTRYTTISEIAGNNGRTVSGIMVFYFNTVTNSRTSVTLSSQKEVLDRLKKDITPIN